MLDQRFQSTMFIIPKRAMLKEVNEGIMAMSNKMHTKIKYKILTKN